MLELPFLNSNKTVTDLDFRLKNAKLINRKDVFFGWSIKFDQ